MQGMDFGLHLSATYGAFCSVFSAVSLPDRTLGGPFFGPRSSRDGIIVAPSYDQSPFPVGSNTLDGIHSKGSRS